MRRLQATDPGFFGVEVTPGYDVVLLTALCIVMDRMYHEMERVRRRGSVR